MPNMRDDAYGLPVTASADTVARYDIAVHGLLGWDGSALDQFRMVTASDPGLALAHIGAGVCLFLEERFAEARAAVEAARAAAATQSDRERSHVEALALWVTGAPGDAERAMRAHLVTWPRDLVVLHRLYYVFFWQGRFPEILDMTTACLSYYEGNSFMEGLHAFALEQAGRCGEAMALAERAIGRNPRDAWAVHALAHAMFEDARFDEGVSRLPGAIDPCTHLGWFRNHLLWHLALMHLSRGEYERVSAMSRQVFERTPSSIPGDLHDAISLLWRFELAGMEVGPRWQPFVAIAGERLKRAGLLFHAAHLGMALAGGQDWATAGRQLDFLRERAPRDATGLMADVLIPLLEGIQAFAARDYAVAADRIEPLRSRIVELGGSRAQRDVFHDTLLEARFRAGQLDRAGALLAERVARRADHVWVTRRERH
jgi:tetratricopeptide (TPR) repeat protein